MSPEEPGDRVTDTVTNWDAFVGHPSVAHAYSHPSSPWIFRGQSRAEHGLCPSLLRTIRTTEVDLSPSNLLIYEDAAREEFEAQAHLYLGPALLAAAPTRVHWWMHMQHFGAPTRLLDWSLSPFVAAYFACERDLDGDGAVWALNIKASDFSMPEDFGLQMNSDARQRLDNFFLTCEPPVTIHLLSQGVLRNERMTAQQGVFMLCSNPSTEHDAFLLNLGATQGKEQMFRKICIPKEQKIDFYRRLRSVNINARSLFPGLDGLGKSISEMVRFDAFADVEDAEEDP
jgi:hypothetical protein